MTIFCLDQAAEFSDVYLIAQANLMCTLAARPCHIALRVLPGAGRLLLPCPSPLLQRLSMALSCLGQSRQSWLGHASSRRWGVIGRRSEMFVVVISKGNHRAGDGDVTVALLLG